MIKVQNHLDRLQRILVSAFYYILRIVLSVGLGLITSRCTLLENFSPFSIILLSVSGNMGLFPTFCYLGSTFGFLLQSFDLSVFKYITALTIIYIIYIIFKKSLKVSKSETAVLSAAACFVSGFLFLLVGQLDLFNILMLICESILICCCIFFISFAIKAFRNCCYLSSREIISAAITILLTIISLHNIYLFGMSVARIVAIFLLFLALYCFKTSHTAVFGCCLGIILSAVGNGGEPIFTAMIVGTLAACVFSAFSDRFALTAYILVYFVVLFFFGKFPWNYFYFAEPLISYAIAFLVPKNKLRTFLSVYIAVKQNKTVEREAPDRELIRACSRDCQSICPKAAVCYEKNIKELADALEMLSNRYAQTENFGDIEAAIPFCIKPHAMADIIEKRLVFSQAESFEDLVEQLNHLSKKMELKMTASNQPIQFLDEEENIIRELLEKRKISVKEINFIVDERNCKKCDIRFILHDEIVYENIIKEVVAPFFQNSLSLKIIETDTEYIAHIKESSRYNVACAALCKTKSGEQISGDTALGFSAGKDLYYLILADGMGSGKEAGIQSDLTIDSIRRLIIGGLSVPGALNVYRSVARFREDTVFATIDICSIDLCQGTANLYKAGAYDSFHLHQNRIDLIRGGGIPLGLSEKDRLRHASIKIDDGDYLILASDGLSILNDQLEEVILKSQCNDVRIFAQKILYHLTKENGNTNDDVTVMVCRFEKNIE